MRKLLWIIPGLWLCGLLAAAGAVSVPLADGTSVSGDIVSFNDNGIIFRTSDDKYTERMPWLKFSQDGLRQLAQNQKIDPFVEPFILPDQPEHPLKPEVKIQNVSRLDRSSPSSLFGGLISSSVGLMALLLIYAANIYAGYEIALFRARPLAAVISTSAALPILGPVIFLAMPSLRVTAATVEESTADTPVDVAAPAETEPHRFAVPGVPGVPNAQAAEEIHIVSGSWQAGAHPAPSESPETEVFQRGQFMFNRRFFETKFAGFFGIARREADKNKNLQVKTVHALFVAERITRITANEIHFEVLRGDSRNEVMVPFSEIQEVQLKHKKA